MKTNPSSSAIAELAPTGTLRVGINHSNFLLSQRDATTGAYRGIAIDIASEIAGRIGKSIAVVGFESPGQMADAAQQDKWDIAFMGSEPARANVIAFSAAYLEIEAGYLVPAGSKIRANSEVDREGIRIAIMNKSAYDLYLTRNLQHATLVRAPSMTESLDLFLNEKLEVLAGLKPWLAGHLAKMPGSRMLDERFTAIQQSIGTPQGRAEGADFLRRFVEEAKADGFIAKLIACHSVQGVAVAPLANELGT
ncbi:MAG: ABC transporter substrate-binding protein [Burkholderiales bacterium]